MADILHRVGIKTSPDNFFGRPRRSSGLLVDAMLSALRCVADEEPLR